MDSLNYSRKDFLRKIFLGSDVPDSEVKNESNVEGTGLNREKFEFLKEYLKWLGEFGKFVEIRNKDLFNIDNNKKLMELSAEIEKHKPQLEKYMQDPIFHEHFNYLTKEISASI